MNKLNSLNSKDFELPTNTLSETEQTLHKQKGMGSRVCEQVKQIFTTATALKKIAETASNHGTRIAASSVTIATGLKYLSNMQFMEGTLITAVGVNEAFNVWKQMNSTSGLADLLNDASAGVGMIQILEEANASSFKVVDSNLCEIREKMKEMNDRMTKIQSLCVENRQEFVNSLKKISSSYEELSLELSEAKDSFEKGQKQIKSSNAMFTCALKQLNLLHSLAQSTNVSDKEKVSQFVETVQEIYNTCQSAQSQMNEGNEWIDSGIVLLKNARDMELEVLEKTVTVIKEVELRQSFVEALAINSRECEKKLDETKEKVDHIQQNNEDMRKILNELVSDLEEAKKQSCDNMGNISLYCGVIPGAAAGFSAGGLPGAFAGGFSGGTIVHNRDTIFNKIDDMINGSHAFVDVNPHENEQVKIKFSCRPTGFFNRFIKKNPQSYTVGIVELSLGNELIKLPFNLNKGYPISKLDLYELQEKMCAKVLKGELTAQECLNVIRDLETKQIHRGKDHKIKTGLVSKENPYFGFIKRACERTVEIEKKTISKSFFSLT